MVRRCLVLVRLSYFLFDSAKFWSAVMAVNHVSSAMRYAAPELCSQIDILRKERKKAGQRCCYLNANGRKEEVATVQLRIMEIDAELATLHAHARQQLITGVAKALTTGAACLRCAASDSAVLSHSLAEEIKRHSDTLATIVQLQKGLGSQYSDAVNTMDASAGVLTHGGEEQATESGAAVAGAGSSTDMACPNCSKICRGVKGLARHQRGCKAVIDVEQVLDAESPANVNSAAAGKEQALDGYIDSEKPCPKSSKILCNERSLRTQSPLHLVAFR